MLLPDGQALPWTEHSERKWLNTLAAEAGYPKETRDYLGRWIPAQSDDYLQTARPIVFRVQEAIAGKLRATPGAFDESEIADIYVERRVAAGVDVATARAEVGLLLVAEVRMVAVPASVGAAEVEETTELAAAAGKVLEADKFPPRPPGASLFVSRTRKQRAATLHILGACPVQPERLSFGYDWVVDPAEAALAGRCRRCWGGAGVKGGEGPSEGRPGEEPVVSPSSESSSSTESSAESASTGGVSSPSGQEAEPDAGQLR